MNITIFRRRFTKWGWDGSLFINGIFFCGTLENCWSRLAQGTYKIALLPVYNQGKGSYSIMPVILKETSRIPKSVIRKPVIMPGNGPYTLKYGSIIIGKSQITGLVAHSEQCYMDFRKKIDEALENEEEISLVIRNWGVEDIPLKYLSLFQ